MNSNVKTFDTVDNLTMEFCQDFHSEINASIKRSGKINIALSGGNTPKSIFKYLSDNYRDEIDWKRINLFWVDERCVPPEDPESNYGMTKKYLLDRINIPGENIHRIMGGSNPLDESIRYSNLISEIVPAKNNLPMFEIIILGLGEDGHTASIFPDQMELLESRLVCEVSIHPVRRQKRITLTGKIINNAVKIYFLVTGKTKSAVVNKIINMENDYLNFPASFIYPDDGRLIWYLDKEAASEIKNN